MSRMRVVVGAFIVGGILLFAGGLFLIGDRRLLFAKQFELNATFGKVTGLQVGGKVRLAGFDAGEVLEIIIPPRPSDRQTTPPAARTTASVVPAASPRERPTRRSP